MADIAQLVDRVHEGKEYSELAELSIEALQGVTAADAEALNEGAELWDDQAAGRKQVRPLGAAISTLAGAK